MTKKVCSISSDEYDEGSFSDILHQYIEAPTKAEFDKVKQKILLSNCLQGLQYWSQGLLLEFILHFKERFKDLDVDSDKWNLEIDKWNWMGIALGKLRAFKWSEEIYRALYDLFCDLQSHKGRIAKGTPLHQIGWVDLLRGTPESIKRSQYYMKLAMLEDKITVDDGFKNLPAYKVLRGEHNLSETYLDRLAQAVEIYKKKHPEDACLRPELIYLEYVIDRSKQERSSLYDLDSKLARQLMEDVKRTTTANEKGVSLEILLAYLFFDFPGL